MIDKQHRIFAFFALIFSLALFPDPEGARAASVNFCSGSDDCILAYVQNDASATVVSVSITQEKGADTCVSSKRKLHGTWLVELAWTPAIRFGFGPTRPASTRSPLKPRKVAQAIKLPTFARDILKRAAISSD